jgi:cytochrome c
MSRMILTVLASAVLAAGLASPAVAELDGEKLFKRKCGACHVMTEKKKLGPGLAGIFGRTAGTFKPFNYSRAMKKAGRADPPLVWSAEAIDAYIANPKEYLPKNKMALRPIRKAGERAAIIKYMEQATAAQ